MVVSFYNIYNIISNNLFLFFSICINLYLMVAWIIREKNIELVEIKIKNLIPSIKFELNKEEKYNSIWETNKKLELELTKLKHKNANLPFIIIIGLFFVLFLNSLNFKKKKEINDLQDDNLDLNNTLKIKEKDKLENK